MSLPANTWDRFKIELEINGEVVATKIVTKGQYEWEVKKMRLWGQAQEYPWAIFKTVTRHKRRVKTPKFYNYFNLNK